MPEVLPASESRLHKRDSVIHILVVFSILLMAGVINSSVGVVRVSKKEGNVAAKGVTSRRIKGYTSMQNTYGLPE